MTIIKFQGEYYNIPSSKIVVQLLYILYNKPDGNKGTTLIRVRWNANQN
jgi:hypothetical protein